MFNNPSFAIDKLFTSGVIINDAINFRSWFSSTLIVYIIYYGFNYVLKLAFIKFIHFIIINLRQGNEMH